MARDGYIVLILSALFSVGIAYLLAFNPQKNPRFAAIMRYISLPLKRLSLLFFIGLNAIPPILIIKDRWLEHFIEVENPDSFWWETLFSLPLSYPLYFLGIWGGFIFSGLIVFFWTRPQDSLAAGFQDNDPAKGETEQVLEGSQKAGRLLIWLALGIASLSITISFIAGRVPSWELLLALVLYGCGWVIEEYGINGPKHFFTTHGGYLLDASMFTGSFCGVLYALFGETQHLVIFLIIFACAALNLFRNQRKPPPIFWISLVSLAALTWKINSWEYVVIGDEYSFYASIRNILESRSAWELVNTTFEGNFVFGAHPYLSSYIQALFMEIFGNQNFGWRFSNPFLVAASLFFFYYFFAYFTGKKIALATTLLLGFSHYLLSFSKIGYNNLQALFALGLVLAALAWSLKSMRLISFTCLGLAIGFCFYVYPAALYVVPLPVIGLLIHFPPVHQAALKRWTWMLLSCLILIYPLFLQPKYWQEKIPGTFLSSTAEILPGHSLENIVVNTVYSSFSYLYIPQESHFVSTGYLDPLSGLFIVFGLAFLTKLMLSRNKSALFLVITYLVTLILVGATHGRNFPTTTRMFLLLPWFTLFTSLGIEWVFDKVSLLFSINTSRLSVILIAAIVALNIYQAYSVDISRSAQYHNTQSLFVKLVREIQERSDIPPKTYYFVTEKEWNTAAIQFQQMAYHLPESPHQIVDLNLENDRLPMSAEEIVRDEDNIIIIRSQVDQNILTDLDVQLKGWGKSMCEITNEEGQAKFQFWHSSDLNWVCEQEQ